MDSLTPDELDLLGLIAEKPELQPLLFRKAKGLRWFDALVARGFLDPEMNPQPSPSKEEGYVSIPYWPVTEYLVAASVNLREKENEAYAKKFWALLLSITNYAKQNQFGNYRTWWQFAKILQNIPPHLVTVTDLEAIDYWLDDPYEHGLVAREIGAVWLNALLDVENEHNKKLSLGVLDLVFKLKPAEVSKAGGRKGEIGSRVNSWYEKKITERVAEKSGTVLGASAVEIFRNRLEFFLTGTKEDKWSSLWRRSIEDHEQDQYADTLETIIINGFRDSLSGCIRSFPERGFEYVASLLESEFQTNRRIAIHAIDKHYLQLNLLVVKALVPESFESNLRHEMWHLLRNHYLQFPPEQRAKVLQIIGTHEVYDESKNIKRTASAYWQAIWYSALRELGDEEARLYRKSAEIAGSEPEHPDFSSYMTVGWGGSKSPISTAEILSLNVEELIHRLNSVTDGGAFQEPGIEGLAKALKEAVKTEPLRFYDALEKFVACDLAYCHELISAYHELWTAKATMPWDDVWRHLIKFCKRLISEDRFWAGENVQPRKSFVANRHWIVGDIARLIEDGVKSDEHAFNPALLDAALEILRVLLDKQEGELFKDEADAVSIAINSPRGRVLEALVNLSLRTCRLAEIHTKEHAEEWMRFEAIYDSELDRSDRGEYEFVTLVSMYLPNFLYLSKSWTLKNLGRIFDQANQQKWRCAIEGYAHVSLVYDEIYSYLESNGDFLRALNDQAIRERARDKIVQNIVVRYLSDLEYPEDAGLMQKLLDRRDVEELSQLVWFCWTLRDTSEKRVRERILTLWPRILAVIDLRSKEGRKIASRLCSWISLISVVNDSNKEWLLAVAPFADEGHGAYGMLESIARLSKTQPNEAWEIWMKMLTGSRPDYPDEAIVESLENLVKQGPGGERRAKAIADQYLKLGNAGPAQQLNKILGTVK